MPPASTLYADIRNHLSWRCYTLGEWVIFMLPSRRETAYFISSELSMVMVLPSILMAPFSSNSERQRRSENFWMPKISAISCRLASSRMVLLCCSVAILMRYCATFSLTEKRESMRIFCERKISIFDRCWMKFQRMRSSVSISSFSSEGLMRRRVVFLLVSTLTGISLLCAKIQAGAINIDSPNRSI